MFIFEQIDDSPWFYEGPEPVIKVNLAVNSSSIDTTQIDKYRQGVEIRSQKHWAAGIVKIHAGEDGHKFKSYVYGQDDCDENSYYTDSEKFNPIDYLNNENYAAVISNDISKSNRSMNGIIEPLSIRSIASFTTIESPIVAHSIKGTLMDGNEDLYGSSDRIIHVHELNQRAVTPFLDLTDNVVSLNMQRFFDTTVSTIKPFVDKRNSREIFIKQVDDALSKALNTMNWNVDEYIPSGSISSTSGFVFDNVWSGTDSIAFGGLSFGLHNQNQSHCNRAKLLPRTIIRKLDSNHAGSEQCNYESFNDRTVTNYVTSSNVSYPSRIQQSITSSLSLTNNVSNLFDNDLNVISSYSRDGISNLEQYIDNGTNSPFSEYALYEQDKVDKFFASGTSQQIAENFSQPLNSKTCLRLSQRQDREITLPDVSGSLFYYNCIDKTFDSIAELDRKSAIDDAVVGLSETASWPLSGHSMRMFSHLGTPITSGSGFRNSKYDTTADTNVLGNLVGIPLNQRVLHEALQFEFNRDTLTCDDYKPNNDQIFTLPIDRPFLIEKAVVEIPIKVGPGWMNDYTACQAIDIDDYSGDFFYDVGGPVITVALLHDVSSVDVLHQQVSSYRNVIMSGTITNYNDSTTTVFNSLTINNGGFDSICLGKFGISDFGTSSTVVSGSNSQFTGSVSVKMESCISNGFLVLAESNMSVPPTTAELKNLYTSEYINSVLSTGALSIKTTFLNPYKRNNSGAARGVDGKSIFGGEFVMPPAAPGTTSVLMIKNPFFIDSNYDNVPSSYKDAFIRASLDAKAIGLVNLNASRVSPYVINPGDKLVLALSKSRSILRASSHNVIDYSYKHDFKLTTGLINIAIYGSYVKEEKEFHNINQRVNDSKSVYSTIIGNDPIIDQFDIEPNSFFYKSFTDSYITGSLATPLSTTSRDFSGKSVVSILTGTREQVFSKELNPNYFNPTPFVGSENIKLASQYYDFSRNYVNTQRILKTVSTSERFYDTMMPNFSDLMQIDGTPIFRSVLNASIGASVFFDAVSSMTVPWGDSLSNFVWSSAFPYEPRYSSVKRTTNISKTFISKYVFNSSSPPYVTASSPIVHSGMSFFTPFVSTSGDEDIKSWIDIKNHLAAVGLRTDVNLSANDTIKFLFGYSKNFEAGLIDDGSGNMITIGSNSYAKQSAKLPGSAATPNAYVHPNIEGWKYGVLNGFPQYSSAIFRRNRYGQLRDMLEQRLDSKFFIENDYVNSRSNNQNSVASSPVQIKFVSKDGKYTSPENTWSSNLSTEATSSVPYFDGEIRNRSVPNPKNLNLSLLNLSQDIFDNIKV